MQEPDETPPNNISVGAEGGATIGGDVTGRDKITNVTNNYYLNPTPPSETDDRRRLRLTVHVAVFVGTGAVCYFINATNLSEREIEVTHVWFDCDPQVPALQPDRLLPKRLKSDETWETWVEAHRLPPHSDELYTLARARLSTGQIIYSQRNENVPDQGFVPGGPISG